MQYRYRYRHEAVSTTGFVQQLVNYITKGYYWYVTGVIPDGKPVADIDSKLLSQYDIAIPQWTRSRRKKNGQANVQYLRFERFFILIATAGYHEFKIREEDAIKDIRQVGVKFHGYDISFRQGNRQRMTPEERARKKELGRGVEVAKPDLKWHARVQIEDQAYRDLMAHMLELSTKRTAEQLSRALWNAPFEPYARVRQQLFAVMWAVNRKRKTQGLEKLKSSCIRTRRNVVKPFGEWQNVLERAA